jgi:ATP-dependent Clp protease, protease subunit
MNRIEIRGVIVPSNWDMSWTKDYIEKGIIAPESAIRRGIDGAAKDKPLEMYINSPGGSVFAAYEVINAISAWRAETKQPVNITIGAMAASAASAIAVLSGARLMVHRNSKLMFHGAWTETVGGSEAHQDTATLLDQINADVKTQLVSKFNIAPETVDGWFSEGRQGWLTAQDAVALGMADNVVDADDEDIEYPEDMANIGEHGIAIAALFDSTKEPKQEDEQENNDGDKPDDESAEAGGGTSEEPAPADEQKADEPEQAEKLYPESEIDRRTALQLTDKTAEISAQLVKAHELLETEKKLVSKYQGDLDREKAAHAKTKEQFESQIAATQDALKRANDRNLKLTIGSLSFSPSIESWGEALRACGGDYVTARKQYPDAYESFMQNQNQRK